MRRSTKALLFGAAAAAAALFATASPAGAAPGTHSMTGRHATPAARAAGTHLSYGGGAIVTSPRVFIVYWGSQWGTTSITNDPSGEAALQLSFFQHMYGAGDTWSTSTTQYCQGVAVGTTQCGASGTHVGHPASNPVGGTWLDSASASPARPTQSQLATEARRTATHFGVSGINVQIIVDTAHGVVPSGFGTQYCAWHSITSGIPYTNMPYVTDVGASCGANFVPPSGGVVGSKEGITIVGGHEYGETVTDPTAGTGWLAAGAENGDLCAWISSGQGASTVVAINGVNYAVQSLYSNNFSGNAGGCVNFYASATNQH